MNLKSFTKTIIPLLSVAMLSACSGSHNVSKKAEMSEPSSCPKTVFQTSSPWDAAYDIRSDASIIYGVSDTYDRRMKSWKEHGYKLQFMTGIAWGNYQDYFLGKVDGKNHLHEGQMERDGDRIMHGRNVPYVVPTEAYLNYMKSLIKKVIDSGITTIYLEEPEFWARSGYSDTFKKKWKEYYGFDWIPPHKSPEATYLSSKLKYHLYYHALDEVFSYAKKYGKSKDKEINCFVPTHSLLNYSAWSIVSPEASLASLDAMDGYIAQVWTGTSREPVYFNGSEKERVFENAFMEYGSMVSMIRPTGRDIYLLTDPIEDNASKSWSDYGENYKATYTAEILYPSVSNYEVMPWPHRIYKGKRKLHKNSTSKVGIPPFYATQMQIMIDALNHMPASENKVSGSHGIGALVSNSMMFQRFPTHKGYTDPRLSNFYGMAMPLLKRGVPVQTVHMENLSYPASLSDVKVLVMSYANMKPMKPEVHKYLAQWIKQGGTLLYYGRDDDPFQNVKEWWNSDGNNYEAPSVQLFGLMNINGTHPEGHYSYGKGEVYITRKDPKELVMQPNADTDFVALAKKAYKKQTGEPLEMKNSFYLERGPYDIVSVMDESVSDQPLTIEGPVIDLYDPELPVLDEKKVRPGEQALLYGLNRIENTSTPQVLAGAARVSKEVRTSNSYGFIAKSPSGTWNVMRILLPGKPRSVKVLNDDRTVASGAHQNWDDATHTLLLQFENSAKGKQIKIKW